MEKRITNIEEFNSYYKTIGISNAINKYIPNLYTYQKTKPNGEQRYLYIGAKDDDPNAYILPDGRFLTMHSSDTIGKGIPMSAFDIVKKYKCNGDSKAAYNYLVNEGSITPNPYNQPTLSNESWLVGQEYECTNLADISLGDIPNVNWLVEGLLPKGYITLVYAAGASGKSTLMAGIAKSCAEQTNFCGRNTSLQEGEKIAFFQSPNEDDKNIIAKKFSKMGITQEAKDKIEIIEPKGIININAFVQIMRKKIEENHIKLLIIDSALALVAGKDDNQSGVVNEVLVCLGNLAKEFNMAIALIHHTRKSQQGVYQNKSDIDNVLGSQRWASGVRFALYISLSKATRETTIKITKENLFGICSEEENEKYNGTLKVKANENLNYSFVSFKPVTEEDNNEAPSSIHQESYDKIVTYITNTSEEEIQKAYSQCAKGKWQFLGEKLGFETNNSFTTAAKKYLQKYQPDVMNKIDTLLK